MRFSFSLPAYDWTVECFVCPGIREKLRINELLEDFGAPSKIIRRVIEKLNTGAKNEGFTYSAVGKRCSVVFISETTDARQSMNTIVHEVRHLTDDIATAENIQMTGEKVAYLSGEIAEKMFKECHVFLCDECRERHKKRRE